jgi:TonB-linked SusC/RagA family outer membrane protein
MNMLHKMALSLLICGCSISLFAQEGKVTGKITDESGAALSGASVVVKGTTNGVVTDARGEYSITVSGNNAVLEVSFLGYVSQDVNVGGRTVINLTLAETTTELEEVVVTALGITREAKKLGYAVTTINAGDLIKTGATNFATALYGKASGVRIQNIQGGAAGGVSISVRGLSSFQGNTQPLVIMNGVPIRNGNANNGSSRDMSASIAARDYASLGSGVRSNGLVDINPEDIESLSILKGAAATALYGSEAANGAIIITSKKAQGKETTIEANIVMQVNMIGDVPPMQGKYGPGSSFGAWNASQSINGGLNTDTDGKLYPQYSSMYWGPAYDGREVKYIDGSLRPYSVIDADPWKKLFKNGNDRIYNVAINHGSEKSNTRFSYTHMKEEFNSLTGDYQKHNFNVVGNLKFNDKISLDYTGNYIVQQFNNRPGDATGIFWGYGSTFGSFMDIDLMKRIYKNSLGYKNSSLGNVYTPDEGYLFNTHEVFAHSIRDMFWGAFENTSEELEQRLIASVAPSWKILPCLTAKARVSTDYTASASESRSKSEFPAAAYPDRQDLSGGYSILRKSYQIVYGDVMLMFDKKLSEKINLTANLGWQGRTEEMKATSVGTSGGLVMDNVFNIKNSKRPTINLDDGLDGKMSLLKTAWMGTIGVSYGDFVFLDVTGRQEKSSTLPKDSRTFFYPSASISFLYTEAFKDYLPSWYKYGKLRASYGIVGNAPEAYAANMAYEAKSDPSGFTWNQIPGSLGNNKLRPEKTVEYEIGIENKLFDNRAGFEVSYYNREISDMLVQVPLAQGSGSNNVWANSGTMVNKGIEIMVYGTPVQTKDFNLTIRTNMGFNKNHIDYLAEGVPFIDHGMPFNAPGVGGARSYAGSSMGDYLACTYKTVTDANSPHYGRRIVNVDGNYVMNPEHVPVLNAMPKVVGGLGVSFGYQNLTLDVLTDFRFGGYIFNYMYWNTMAMGVNKQTENREGDGFSEIDNGNGMKRKIGIRLDGVVEQADGSYVENTKDIAYDTYIQNAFGVGGAGTNNQTMLNGLFKNDWWKLRELSLSYAFPKQWISHLAMRNLSLSVFGRNLFYFTKSVPDYDPETSNSTDWKAQLVIGHSAAPTRTVGFSLRASF